MTSLKRCNDREEWDDFCLERGANPLQLWGWGEVKVSHGWLVDRLFFCDEDEIVVGAAQLLIKHLPWPFRALVYVPRGPVVDETNREGFLQSLADYARKNHHGVSLMIEPDDVVYEIPDGWRQSSNRILPSETIVLDLKQTEAELMSAMAKKTRQYIRKSSSEAVDVRLIKARGEIDKCLNIYHQTAKRAGFNLHSDQYYRDIFVKLADHSPIFAAYNGDEMVAFLWLAISSDVAYELYGGVNETGQQLRANYTLKWQAIRKCKQWGLRRYDFGGLIDGGVSTFKLGWAEKPTELAGSFEKPLSIFYGLWSKLLPAVKKLMQKLKSPFRH